MKSAGTLALIFFGRRYPDSAGLWLAPGSNLGISHELPRPLYGHTLLIGEAIASRRSPKPIHSELP